MRDAAQGVAKRNYKNWGRSKKALCTLEFFQNARENSDFYHVAWPMFENQKYARRRAVSVVTFIQKELAGRGIDSKITQAGNVSEHTR